MGEYSIGDAIEKFLEQSRIRGSIQALQIGDIWEEIMGKTIARYTEEIKIINDTLFITTHVAPLKQELIFQKEKIKLRVNEALGKKDIKEIVIKYALHTDYLCKPPGQKFPSCYSQLLQEYPQKIQYRGKNGFQKRA